jgi:Cu/Ag efflux pump CusA
MSAKSLRIVGLICLLSAAVLMVLNLKRVSNLGTFWIALPLLLIGTILILRARNPS